MSGDEISLSDQLTCVRREIALRERIYPKRVQSGLMRQEVADRELDAMRAVLATLQNVEIDLEAPL